MILTPAKDFVKGNGAVPPFEPFEKSEKIFEKVLDRVTGICYYVMALRRQQVLSNGLP